jgi:hypothetical protein
LLFVLAFEPIQAVPVPATIRLASPLALAWLLTACPSWPTWEGCADALECSSTSTSIGGSTGEASVPTMGGGFQTVTGSDESSSSSSSEAEPGTGTSGTSGGEAIEPPAIVTVALNPDPIHVNGPIAATVAAEFADGVRMKLDTGELRELGLVEPGIFGGEIVVLSGLDNGTHPVWLTPWRADVEGVVVEADYLVDLPTPGTQVYWETDDAIGPGQVAALGTLPDGDVVEFGTHYPDGAPRCYLRRRDKKAMLGPDPLEEVLPDTECTAIDLQVDELGAMFVLVNRQGGDGQRWWSARIPAWGLGATALGTGAKGETAVALAHHPSGMVAVCGSSPTPATDVDAMVQLFRPNLAVETLTFDYQPAGKGPHWNDERTRDCVFTGDELALVGEAYGRHGDEDFKLDRLFILRLDTMAKSGAWMVAPPGVRTQSGAQAVDVDEQGRLVVAGYTCDDACQPEGDLRIYDPKDTLVWQVSLGAFPSKALATQDLAWSPAGYAVVATGGLKDNEAAFTVRAFAQSQVGPLWTFAHKDIQVLNMALALAIGRYGEVYAGGMGANGYPAVAGIGG